MAEILRLDYHEFLKDKVKIDSGWGFEVGRDEINPALKEFNRDIVQWALRGGRRACFAAYGLHKTCTQLELMRLVGTRQSGLRLITLPLGVRQEFFLDAEQFFTGDYTVNLKFIQSEREIEDDRKIYLTNYETVREGKLALKDGTVAAISLDEADILRGFGGTKTFREMMKHFEFSSAYRFVNTATPSPNDYIELLSYAAFLGIMDVGQAKTRFFKRDSEKADALTLMPHMERDFWLWVASWAIFILKPSDLGYSDEGYELPPLDVRWHELPSDHKDAGQDKIGQMRLLKNTALGVQQAASEKRDSLPARIEKLLELRQEAPDAHRIIWHDLEAERKAIEAAIPGAVSVYGSQPLDEREKAVIGFRRGEVAELAGKPVMLGAGCNFQHFCNWEIFLGIGFKFRDAIQAIHRVQRFGQTKPVRIDFIYTEAEREIRSSFEQKWRQHDEMVAKMTAIIREHGLSSAAMMNTLTRSLGAEREEASGSNWRLVRNDSVVEAANRESDSVHLIVSSIPFGTQYEYSPNYADFGHTESPEHFWQQMDFLTPELFRILQPGRDLLIHVKDRIVPGGLSKLGFQTVYPFHADAIRHYTSHGFGYLGMKTIVTDVVRENKQTNRLGWSEQCKDGSRMGCGMPEYLLIFRKPPTDRSDGYADVPVAKDKQEYTRGRWQFDAHGFMRSSGNRLLTVDDLKGCTHEQVFKLFKKHSLGNVYDYERDVEIADYLDSVHMLPPSFMLLQPQSWHEDVWTDIARMRTMNTLQAAKNREQHLCPLPFDIVKRAITQHSMPGETVLDMFSGLGTVAKVAVELGRFGEGWELSDVYWRESVNYLRATEAAQSIPALFDLIEIEEEDRQIA